MPSAALVVHIVACANFREDERLCRAAGDLVHPLAVQRDGTRKEPAIDVKWTDKGCIVALAEFHNSLAIRVDLFEKSPRG